ncbi:hypothetical protein BGZ54_004807 [Gamsiella multidivaricata]|nr:hypothetical protein BGZ54_004807 [Gamsiella multidivaricata]
MHSSGETPVVCQTQTTHHQQQLGFIPTTAGSGSTLTQHTTTALARAVEHSNPVHISDLNQDQCRDLFRGDLRINLTSGSSVVVAQHVARTKSYAKNHTQTTSASLGDEPFIQQGQQEQNYQQRTVALSSASGDHTRSLEQAMGINAGARFQADHSTDLEISGPNIGILIDKCLGYHNSTFSTSNGIVPQDTWDHFMSEFTNQTSDVSTEQHTGQYQQRQQGDSLSDQAILSHTEAHFDTNSSSISVSNSFNHHASLAAQMSLSSSTLAYKNNAHFDGVNGSLSSEQVLSSGMVYFDQTSLYNGQQDLGNIELGYSNSSFEHDHAGTTGDIAMIAPVLSHFEDSNTSGSTEQANETHAPEFSTGTPRPADESSAPSTRGPITPLRNMSLASIEQQPDDEQQSLCLLQVNEHLQQQMQAVYEHYSRPQLQPHQQQADTTTDFPQLSEITEQQAAEPVQAESRVNAGPQAWSPVDIKQEDSSSEQHLSVRQGAENPTNDGDNGSRSSRSSSVSIRSQASSSFVESALRNANAIVHHGGEHNSIVHAQAHGPVTLASTPIDSHLQQQLRYQQLQLQSMQLASGNQVHQSSGIANDVSDLRVKEEGVCNMMSSMAGRVQQRQPQMIFPQIVMLPQGTDAQAAEPRPLTPPTPPNLNPNTLVHRREKAARNHPYMSFSGKTLPGHRSDPLTAVPDATAALNSPSSSDSNSQIESDCNNSRRSATPEAAFESRHSDSTRSASVASSSLSAEAATQLSATPPPRASNNHQSYGNYPIKCKIPSCTRSFASLGLLKSHMVSHREEKPYWCDICSYDGVVPRPAPPPAWPGAVAPPMEVKRYKRNHDLLRHKREQHPPMEVKLQREAERQAAKVARKQKSDQVKRARSAEKKYKKNGEVGEVGEVATATVIAASGESVQQHPIGDGSVSGNEATLHESVPLYQQQQQQQQDQQQQLIQLQMQIQLQQLQMQQLQQQYGQAIYTTTNMAPGQFQVGFPAGPGLGPDNSFTSLYAQQSPFASLDLAPPQTTANITHPCTIDIIRTEASGTFGPSVGVIPATSATGAGVASGTDSGLIHPSPAIPVESPTSNATQDNGDLSKHSAQMHTAAVPRTGHNGRSGHNAGAHSTRPNRRSLPLYQFNKDEASSTEDSEGYPKGLLHLCKRNCPYQGEYNRARRQRRA